MHNSGLASQTYTSRKTYPLSIRLAIHGAKARPASVVSNAKSTRCRASSRTRCVSPAVHQRIPLQEPSPKVGLGPGSESCCPTLMSDVCTSSNHFLYQGGGNWVLWCYQDIYNSYVGWTGYTPRGPRYDWHLWGS